LHHHLGLGFGQFLFSCFSNRANSRISLAALIPRNGGVVTQEVTTTRANGYLFFSFFSRFSFRFSSGLRWAFFCDSFFALSLLPLSPISGSPYFGVRNVVDHIDATIVGRAEAKSNRGESRYRFYVASIHLSEILDDGRHVTPVSTTKNMRMPVDRPHHSGSPRKPHTRKEEATRKAL
jgi:hypothetical protein